MQFQKGRKKNCTEKIGIEKTIPEKTSGKNDKQKVQEKMAKYNSGKINTWNHKFWKKHPGKKSSLCGKINRKPRNMNSGENIQEKMAIPEMQKEKWQFRKKHSRKN